MEPSNCIWSTGTHTVGNFTNKVPVHPYPVLWSCIFSFLFFTTPSNMISYGVGLLTSGWFAFNSANYFLVCIETFNLATSLSLIDNAIITLYVSETFFCMFLYYFLRVFLHPCFLFSSVSNFPCTHSHDKLYLVVIQMDVFPWKPFWETFQLSFKLLLFYTAWAIPTSWQFSITSTNPSSSSISPVPVSSSFSQC